MHKNSCYGTIVYIQHIKITESERVWKDTKMNRSGPNTWGGNDRNNNNGLAPRINNSGMPADEKDYNAQPGGYHDYNSDGDASRRGREGGNEGNSDSRKRDAPPAAAAAAAYHQRNNDSQKKPKIHQIRPCDALTPEQNQYRELVATQLQEGETVGWIHLQAFRHPEGWDKKKALAAEHSKICVLEELKKIPPGSAYNYSDDDGSDSDYSYVRNKPTKTPGTLTALESKFYDSLPKCTMMMLGFDIGDKGEESTSL